MTYREAISGFRSLIADRTGFISDQNPWSNRLILKHLVEYRSRIIAENERKKGRELSKQDLQTIPCVPLIKVDDHECPCAPPSGCYFLRTKYPVPKPVTDYASVTSIHGQINYAYVEWNKIRYKLNSRLKGQTKAPYYTIKNSGEGNHLYLLNDTHKKFITVTGIFYDPLELVYYPDCSGEVNDCKAPLDQEFIIDPDLLTVVYERCLQALLPARANTGVDILNNDQDETSGAQPPM